MIAIEDAAGADRSPEPASGTYRRLLCAGFGAPEAANLTALKNGLGICSRPWAVRELTHLMFLRESRRVGRRWSDTEDRVDRSDGTRVPAPVEGAPAPAVEDRASVPAVQSRHRDDIGPSDGRVTLLTMFRAMAGPSATLDLPRPSGPPRLDAAGESDSEGG
jgi:hypothetical protein